MHFVTLFSKHYGTYLLYICMLGIVNFLGCIGFYACFWFIVKIYEVHVKQIQTVTARGGVNEEQKDKVVL